MASSNRSAMSRHVGLGAWKARVTPDLLAHWMHRHPDGMPQPDAEVEEAGGKVVPVWLPGRDAEWAAWHATFPGRTGRPRK
jgi:hypothetical protein